MIKVQEFIKRGIIIGLAIVTIGGAVLPPTASYAANFTTSVSSSDSNMVLNADTTPASLDRIDTKATSSVPVLTYDEYGDISGVYLPDGTEVSTDYDTVHYIGYLAENFRYIGKEKSTGLDVYESIADGHWRYIKTYFAHGMLLVDDARYDEIDYFDTNYSYYQYLKYKETGYQLGYTDTKTGKHIGSTGHITNIKDDVRDWEYKAPDYIITELELPLNYVNPWYTSENDADPAKNVKTYYYLGTVIYNDTDIRDAAYNYESLSDDEKEIYKELKDIYERKLKSSSAYNAKASIISNGTKLKSEDLPLIYELLTGEKFDWLYWYNEGIATGVENYSDYGKGTIGSGKISHGVKSNYATKVTVSSSKEGIAQIYKIVKDGEARVYVKGLKKGTTTLIIKTTLNDGKTVSYKTKVTIKDAASPIKYKTDVNPLSYAAYALKQDGGNWLGYLSKFGEFYSKDSSVGGAKITNQTGDVDVVSVYAHPTLDSSASYFTGGTKYYKKKLADTSSYMKDFLKKAGAFDMLARGESEYKIFRAVQKAIDDAWGNNIDSGKQPQKGKSAYHYALKGFLEGRVMACEDHAAITAGIAELLGFNYYTQGIKNDILTVIVLDGKHYTVKATTMSEYEVANNPMTITLPKLTYSYKSLADVPLSDLVSGKYILNIKGTNANGAGLFYKVSDKYEAGRFKYGAEVAPPNEWYGTTKINDFFGVLEADKGDIRLLTLRAGIDPAWDNTEQNTVTFRYAVPYMERAYFTLKKGSTKQLHLVNSDWSEWTIKTSDSKIATVNSTGKVTMKGTGTATITLTHKTIKGLSIKVLVSTSTIKEATAETKAGTFYSKNDSIYTNGTYNIIAGDYMRIHD